jgi:hypothetical protein
LLLKYTGGAAVVAGQFGDWSPIGAERTATGYEVVWMGAATRKLSVWTVDSSGNYVSSTAALSGATETIRSREVSFYQDLNGDGTIGAPTMIIEATGATSLSEIDNHATIIEAAGATSLSKINSNFYLSDVDGGAGLLLKYTGGVAVIAGQFGDWSPIGAEQTATGYEVVWMGAATRKLSVWTVDSSGNYVSSTAAMSGTTETIRSRELSFYQDLNGDGFINTPSTVIDISGNVLLKLNNMAQSATIDTGATLELTGAVSGSITFNGPTGTLVLDRASLFTGTLINLTGDGSASNSNQIDLKDIAYGSTTLASYSGNEAGGVLTVIDIQGHAAHLSLVGNYTHSKFNLSDDGSGGTLVIDPPMDQFHFASVSTPQTAPTETVAAEVGIGSDGFVFEQVQPLASPDHFAVEALTADALRSAPDVGGDPLEAVVMPVGAHPVDFNNFMLH